MANNPTIAIQTAIYTLLKNDTTLMALITGVFDSVPQGTLYPYITISDLVNKDWGSNTFDGVDGYMNVSVWSQQFSSLETKQIMARLYTLLHNISLTVIGFSACLIRFDTENIMLDPDGVTHHGVQRFRYLVGS